MPVDPADATTGSLATALAHARRLLARDPALARKQAAEILRVVPGQSDAVLLLAEALAASGEDDGALAALRAAATGDKAPPAVWRALADRLSARGDADGADAAHMSAVAASVTDPGLVRAALDLRDGCLHEAEHALRDHLKAAPTDVAAIRMFAEVAARIGRYQEAANLLERAVQLCPGFDEARHSYALVLQRLNRPSDALVQAEALLAKAPCNPSYRLLQASALVRLGEQEKAAAVYESLVADRPALDVAWLCLGHVWKALGRTEACVAAYRLVAGRSPTTGEAWWSLANLKTFRFAPAEVAAMRDALAREDLPDDDRLHLNYALGAALEAAGEDDEAFERYAAGNAIRRAQLGYDASATTRARLRTQAVFHPALLAARAGAGCTAPDPIFVVGLPRSGSTLVEQILASHPLVEATAELPDILAIAARLGAPQAAGRQGRYPEALAELPPEELRALGQEYLDRTRAQRKTDRPFFVDKMPNNWLHAGLIMLILPNARIVDARRDPMACCWANFKQHFARGQGFTCDLGDLARYWRDYAALMAHFDAVAPGRVHRVQYEALVADLEGEVRRLLAYCALPFDPACLRFHETRRAVRTASAEQVRQPIYSSGLDQWRRFEHRLEPARRLLEPAGGERAGDVADAA